MKAMHTKDGRFIGWLNKEFSATVSVINFVGIKSKPVVSAGWRKSNLKEYEEATK